MLVNAAVQFSPGLDAHNITVLVLPVSIYETQKSFDIYHSNTFNQLYEFVQWNYMLRLVIV